MGAFRASWGMRRGMRRMRAKRLLEVLVDAFPVLFLWFMLAVWVGSFVVVCVR